MKLSQIFRLLIIAIASCILATTHAVSAQGNINASITKIDDTQFPLISTYVSVSDAQGFPILGLDASAFSIMEDEAPVDEFSIEGFSNTEEPISFALAIDTSASMARDHALSQAEIAARAFSSSLTALDQIGLVAFSDQATSIASPTSDKDSVLNAISQLTADGDTALYDGVAESISMLSELSAGRRAVVLLTDGCNTTGLIRDPEIAALEAIRVSIPIYAIGFGDKADLCESEV
ncbi:MAG TPA: VWA domain-containing protein, partial [Anaerolineae bacterium]|nr:VWA domain-containing protein [Anaerolineae bacterium]